jgi:hypothetical protein
VADSSRIGDNPRQEAVMGEVIRLEEIDRERRRTRARVAERAHLERAVTVLKENLAATAQELRDAPAASQADLLGRIERFAAMIRYGLRMLGETPGDELGGGPSTIAGPR